MEDACRCVQFMKLHNCTTNWTCISSTVTHTIKHVRLNVQWIGGLYDKTNITIVLIPIKYQSFLVLNDACICTASSVIESVTTSVSSTDLIPKAICTGVGLGCGTKIYYMQARHTLSVASFQGTRPASCRYQALSHLTVLQATGLRTRLLCLEIGDVHIMYCVE